MFNKKITITISIDCNDDLEEIIEAIEDKLEPMIQNINKVDIDDFFIEEIRVDRIKERVE